MGLALATLSGTALMVVPPLHVLLPDRVSIPVLAFARFLLPLTWKKSAQKTLRGDTPFAS
ncbi:MAG: hypothetical protein ACK5O7_00200 [Holosporales bacterium]